MVSAACPLPSCFRGDIPGRPTLHMCIQRVSVPRTLTRLAIWTRLGPPNVTYTMVSASFIKFHPKSPNATHAQVSAYLGAPGLPVESVWKECGQGLDRVWTGCGQGVERVWTQCGVCVEDVRPTGGMPLLIKDSNHGLLKLPHMFVRSSAVWRGLRESATGAQNVRAKPR